MAKRLLIAAAALAVSSVATITPSAPAAAASFTMTVSAPVVGGIGIDAIYTGGNGGPIYDVPPCSHAGPSLQWNGAGQLVGTNSVPDSKPGLGTLTKVRFEFYPGPCGTYDPWASNVGGVHIETTAGNSNLGTIGLPVDGQFAFRIDGDIIASTPITEGRLQVDTFQIPTAFPDPPMPVQQNGSVTYGAFATSSSQGSQWTGGVGWAGRYILFVRDTATGRGLHTIVDIAPGNIPTIDLDAICWGFEWCVEDTGSPPPVPGEFFPLPPTRFLDTRLNLGITNGPVRTGDGRNSSPNPITRRDETANHEVKVTGNFGVPEDGVSAVLINLTAVGAPGPGFVSVVPKPARVGDVFNDQASYGAFPSTSNLNVDGPGAVANMVLARVGAGGKIRFHNFFGPTQFVADIAGYFGTPGLHNDGFGFEGVLPGRAMDSRLGIGGPATPFEDGEVRDLKVTEVFGVPASAESVVLNITSILPEGEGSFVTAYPTGQAAPNASNVNGVQGGVRANLAVVKVGDDGMISIKTFRRQNILVDVFGSFGPYGGAVTTMNPVRAVDSRGGQGTEQRPLFPGESRTVVLAGQSGVPANATAVIANLTATNATAGGFLLGWPTGSPRPTVSNVNFGPGQTVPNLVMIKLGNGGAIDVYNGLGATDFIIDIMASITG